MHMQPNTVWSIWVDFGLGTGRVLAWSCLSCLSPMFLLSYSCLPVVLLLSYSCLTLVFLLSYSCLPLVLHLSYCCPKIVFFSSPAPVTTVVLLAGSHSFSECWVQTYFSMMENGRRQEAVFTRISGPENNLERNLQGRKASWLGQYCFSKVLILHLPGIAAQGAWNGMEWNGKGD